MVKQFMLLILLLISSNISANDAAITRYIEAEKNMLQAQIAQLEEAISLLSSGISTEQQYEQIGKPSFSAINKALAQSGYSIKRFYRFQSDYKFAIEQWLSEHYSEASQLKQLKSKRDGLTLAFDGAN